MVTNGTALSAEVIRLIKSCDISVSVSLDGPAEFTDRFRNAGTYERAAAGFRLLRDSGVNPGISCTLPSESLDRFGELLQWLEASGTRNVGFNLVTKPAPDYDSPDYHQRGTELLIRAFERFRETGVYEDRIMRKLSAFVERRVYPFDCAACGGTQLVVSADGKVGLCPAFLGSGKTFVGDVYDETFIPEQHQVWHEWSMRSPLNIPECTNCSCLGICGGGCPANNPNDIWEVGQGFCAHSRTILNWLIWDLFDQARNRTVN